MRPLVFVKMPSIGAPDLIARLAHEADSCERSWSIHDGRCEERCLFFFDNEPDRAVMLAETAVALGFPRDALMAWSRTLPGADAVGLAVSRDLASIRLYVQYWEAIRSRVIQGEMSPAPLYVGVKALRSGRVRHDVYVCLPAAPRDLFWPRIEQALVRLGCNDAAVQPIFNGLTAATCIYTETASVERRSWLATVRRADIDPRDLAACLPRTSALSEVTDTLTSGAPLVHIAGGTDSAKGDFVTLYTEADAKQVEELFIPPTC